MPPPEGSSLIRRFTPLHFFLIGLVVMIIIPYVTALGSYRSARAELQQQEEKYSELARTRDRLKADRAILKSPAATEARARALGYIYPGEIVVSVKGIENEHPPVTPPAPPRSFWDFLPSL